MNQSTNANLWPLVPHKELLDLRDDVPYFWNLNLVYIKNGEVIINGWALPYNGIAGGTGIAVNGHLLGNTVFGESKEVAKKYPWWPNAIKSTFSISVSADELPLFEEEELLFEALPIAEKSTYHSIKLALYFQPGNMLEEFPNDVIQNRIGSPNSFHYSMMGLTLARQFVRVFEKYSERLWSQNELIVDWGCGSGRVARHIIKGLNPNQQFMGFDIDKSAIDWANANIADFFKQSRMDPPLGIEAGAVDVLLAYSVLTHLSLNDLRKWVKEAARVLKKDGYFIFTILSDTAFVDLMPYAKTSIISEYCNKGIYDTQENDQLESMGVSGDYYRNVWLHKDFIKSEMQEFFEIVAVERNFHYYQDVVVCRRK